MRTKAPLDRAAQPSQLMANMHRWKFSALAAAAVLSTGFYAADASALALGRITVQSALGEPLRAEIELPQITAAEAESLRAQTAAPEAFRAQGMEYSPTVNGLQIQLQRRTDGTAVLRLSSSRPVNEPFVDLVLDATWSSGRIVRSYTMLFDPPAMRQAPATVTAAPQISAPAPAPAAMPPAVAAAPAPRAMPPAAAVPAPAPAPAPQRVTARLPSPAQPGSVTVQAGDTAGRLASTYRSPGVSLDQMLVAMMRANPDAFVQGNVNRLKAGAVLQMPDEAAAQAIPSGEARQIVAAQSRDFNEFRRKLASSVPKTEVAATGRSASGSVQTQVEDKRPATAAPDKLTLSKGALPGQKSADDKLAKDKQAGENSARIAELSKNISDLNKLSAASAPAGAGTTPAPAPTAPGVPVAVQGPAAAASAAPAAAASTPPPASATPEAAPAPAAAASAPEAPAAAEAAAPAASAPAPAPARPKPAAAAPEPAPEPSFLASLMDDPMIPMAGGGLLALLLGYGAYRVVQRRRSSAGAGVDSTFMESKLQPDSFFGASGGQRVDTASSEMTTGSSMAYSPSQLDAGGDVDPVAEADVYLAYGRDLQAEEILKEAARHNPGRVSVHVKLAEIYAKRQDRKALEAVAGDVFRLTQGQGADWARVAELGRELDPSNPSYQPGGQPGAVEESPDSAPAPISNFASTMAASAAAVASAPPSVLPPDLDLDLDLDLPSDALSEAPSAPPAAPGGFAAAAAAAGALAAAPTPAPVAAPELDLGALEESQWNAEPAPTAAPAPVAPAMSAPAQAPAAEPQLAALDFPTDDLALLDSAAAPLTHSQDQAVADADAGMDFDLGDLSLDLGTSPAPIAAAAPAASAAAPANDAGDPLSTKLALAEEFHAIGDSDGARTLIEEVIAEASGPLKARAQRLLADIA